MTTPEVLPRELELGIEKSFEQLFIKNGEKPLAGKVALVTNIARGIGDEIAIKLAEEGAKIMGVVGINDSREEAKKDAMHIEYNGGWMELVNANLNTFEGRGKVQRRVGEIDIFVLPFLVTGGNNTLIDDFLPYIRNGGEIILVGHKDTAREMKSLRERIQIMPEFVKKGISFAVIFLPVEKNNK